LTYRLPITDHRSPITDYFLLLYAHISNLTSLRSPLTSHISLLYVFFITFAL